MAVTERTKKLTPLLKYPGGKEKELKYILPHLPKDCERFFDPFVGGGAVYFAISADEYFINDKSAELVRLYDMIRSGDAVFLRTLEAADAAWRRLEEVSCEHCGQILAFYDEYRNGLLFTGAGAEDVEKETIETKRLASQTHDGKKITTVALREKVHDFVYDNAPQFLALLTESIAFDAELFLQEEERNLFNKLVRMAKLETEKGDLSPEDRADNLEGALKAGFYMYFRDLYNHTAEYGIGDAAATAIYLFVREFCYASMFRYNQNGEFNVPYGGISYNKKSILKKLRYFTDEALREQLAKSVIECMDFEDFLNRFKPREQDFVFLDPPYDTEFSTYAQNAFGRNAHLRLANYLINHCEGKFMLVIKNTDFIRNLYCSGMYTANGGRLYVSSFAKKYMVSFQERNDKNSEHLMITNYEITGGACAF
ncbi:MAG: DNA adenine methylase [Lachnospiraceae bacterium]|nr:DNA adenine methylase [Lachnospiraceae bacterium]